MVTIHLRHFQVYHSYSVHNLDVVLSGWIAERSRVSINCVPVDNLMSWGFQSRGFPGRLAGRIILMAALLESSSVSPPGRPVIARLFSLFRRLSRCYDAPLLWFV